MLLMATATTGLTMSRSLECIDYYGGNVRQICCVFSAIDQINGQKVESIFTTDDVPGYQHMTLSRVLTAKISRSWTRW